MAIRAVVVVVSLLGAAPAWSRVEPAVDLELPLIRKAAPVVDAPLPELPYLVTHGPREAKRVALTFDACSTGDTERYDAEVIDILTATQTPATLFLGGRWMEAEPERTRALAAEPLFELGLHAHAHPYLTRLSDDSIRRELTDAQARLQELTGRTARYYRPPFGDVDARVARVAADAGFVTVMYDLASGDPDPQATAPRLIAWIDHMVQGGSIIVLHMNRRGVHTAEALPEIIASLRARGFELVTVGQLLEDDLPVALGPGEAWPEPLESVLASFDDGDVQQSLR